MMSNMSAPASAGDTTAQDNAALIVGGVVLVVAIITVVLRFYTRISTRIGLWWDDWLILIAVVVTVATAALLIASNSVNPNGAMLVQNTDPDYKFTIEDETYAKLSFLSSLFYFTIAGATKLGILLMYHRLFKTDRMFRAQLAIAIFLVLGWWVGCTIAGLTNCIPLKYVWINALADPRHCINFNIFWMAAGVCEVFIDIVVLALPIRVIWGLQLSTRNKLTVACIFLLGGFVIITGLLKVIFGFAPLPARNPAYSNTEVWTAVHAGMAIICANLPAYRPLIIRVSKSPQFAKFRSMMSFSRHRIYTRSRSGVWSTVAGGRSGHVRANSEAPSETEALRSNSEGERGVEWEGGRGGRGPFNTRTDELGGDEVELELERIYPK